MTRSQSVLDSLTTTARVPADLVAERLDHFAPRVRAEPADLRG
jgi:hypothetical protein